MILYMFPAPWHGCALHVVTIGLPVSLVVCASRPALEKGERIFSVSGICIWLILPVDSSPDSGGSS